MLGWIRGKNGGDDGSLVDFDDGLGEILEEVHDALPPDAIDAGLLPGVHQHLVDQHQCGQAVTLRRFRRSS